MKNEGRGYLLKGLLATALLGMLFWLVATLFDDVFNGVVREWVYSFIVDSPYASGYSFDWYRAQQTAYGIAALFALVLGGTGALSAYFAARGQRRRQTRELVAFMDRLLREGEAAESLPAGYAEIELRLRKMVEEAARDKRLAETEAQRKSDLITYLAHDLKTPLASVIGYLSLLSEAPDLPEAQRAKYTGVTLEKAYRLEQLIAELFEIIRFNLQAITLDTERIRLPFMLEQLADEFYPLLLPQGKTVRVEAQEGLTVTGDADKLARVFNNILKNAAAYSYENSEIVVAAHREGEKVEIAFSNQGDPIPAHKQAVIFEKFYRLDNARSSKTGGAGLGLAIAREIVEAHGGSIAVVSGKEGTTFTVVLPDR